MGRNNNDTNLEIMMKTLIDASLILETLKDIETETNKYRTIISTKLLKLQKEVIKIGKA